MKYRKTYDDIIKVPCQVRPPPSRLFSPKIKSLLYLSNFSPEPFTKLTLLRHVYHTPNNYAEVLLRMSLHALTLIRVTVGLT